MGLIYSASECVIEQERGTHDLANAVYAGCFTGGFMAMSGGPWAAASGKRPGSCRVRCWLYRGVSGVRLRARLGLHRLALWAAVAGRSRARGERLVLRRASARLSFLRGVARRPPAAVLHRLDSDDSEPASIGRRHSLLRRRR